MYTIATMSDLMVVDSPQANDLDLWFDTDVDGVQAVKMNAKLPDEWKHIADPKDIMIGLWRLDIWEMWELEQN